MSSRQQAEECSLDHDSLTYNDLLNFAKDIVQKGALVAHKFVNDADILLHGVLFPKITEMTKKLTGEEENKEENKEENHIWIRG
jgi:hypothetical protein